MNSVLKKTAVTLLTAIVFYGLAYYEGRTADTAILRVYLSYPTLLFVAVVYGPLAGAASGLLGQIILQTGVPAPDWAAVICTTVYCALVGFFCRNIDIRSGFFDRKDATRFNNIQMLSAVSSVLALYPALSVLIRHVSWQDALHAGFFSAVNMILGGMLIATLFLALYAKTRLSAANFYRS